MKNSNGKRFVLIFLSNTATELQVILLYMVHRFGQHRLLAQIFSLSYLGTDVYLRLAVKNRQQRPKCRFWVTPGRTEVCLQNFLDKILLFQRNNQKIFACQKKTFINYVMKVAKHFGIDPM